VLSGAVAALAGLRLGSPVAAAEGDDLALDTAALLARIAEQPGGARAIVASSELVTRLVDFLGESEDGRMVLAAKVAVLGDGHWPSSAPRGLEAWWEQKWFASDGGHRSSRWKKK
jgi:hypothetical protein